MLIERVSRLTGKKHVLDIPVTEEQLKLWNDGAYIQDVMPNLTPSQREFLISGATQEEWDEAFPPEEDG